VPPAQVTQRSISGWLFSDRLVSRKSVRPVPGKRGGFFGGMGKGKPRGKKSKRRSRNYEVRSTMCSQNRYVNSKQVHYTLRGENLLFTLRICLPHTSISTFVIASTPHHRTSDLWMQSTLRILDEEVPDSLSARITTSQSTRLASYRALHDWLLEAFDHEIAAAMS
jgi:hypothetical protein